MKTNILILLCFSFFSIFGQEEEQLLYTRAGFKGGMNLANISGDVSDTQSRLRVHLGAVIEFPVSSNFFVQMEVLYSAQGYKVEAAGVENEISLNYLALPLVAKYFVTKEISLETGPRFATLANESNSIGDESDDFFNTYNGFDFGWTFGTGYKFESGMFFQLRYDLGLSNIFNEDIIPATNRNGVAQLSIGYLFKTKNNRRQIYGEQ